MDAIATRGRSEFNWNGARERFDPGTSINATRSRCSTTTHATLFSGVCVATWEEEEDEEEEEEEEEEKEGKEDPELY
ncbi:unnamed protein product [Mesocestoides corti]|uniref:Uncharacterized protein n=1 Tax=Mesocestoides corti TaxID=53468 RepID=A0A0R3UAD1_MESCO|nr:unnamed protein product [Mesocestoides corti]